MKNNESGDTASNMPQVCFRVHKKQAKRLDTLGRIEKRRLSQVFRICLTQALDVWECTHPAATVRKFKLTP